MRILKIWFSEYPWDIRVEKIVQALMSDGHEVRLLCRNNWGEKMHEQNPFPIYRLPYLKKGNNVLNKLINLPAFFNPLWVMSIFNNLKRNRTDLIIVRDLPLTIPAILVGNLFKVKVIFDMAECHPEIFRNYFRWNFTSLFIQNPVVARVIERFTIKNVDHIFVMCKESGERLVALGADHAKITVISNTTVIDPDRKETSRKKGELRLIYTGLLTSLRGVDIVIKGVKKLKNDYNLDVKFDIIGVGVFTDWLKSLVRELHLEDDVIFHGWVEHRKVEQFIREADIGVLPLYNVSHYNVTLANKLFDYMACSKPVITSDVVSMARIVQESGCGLIYKDKNIDQFVKCVLTLSDAQLRNELGENGRKAVKDKYNWNIDAMRMLEVVNSISKEESYGEVSY